MVVRHKGKGRRSTQEKFEEAKARGIEGAEWLDTNGVAILLSGTPHGVKNEIRLGWLPPAKRNTKPHKWRRSDLLAREELNQLDLFGDWLELRQEHGEHVAWAMMLKRLEKARAEIDALAQAVAR